MIQATGHSLLTSTFYRHFLAGAFTFSTADTNMPVIRVFTSRNEPVRLGAHNCQNTRGKSGPALGGMEYRLMPSACRLIVRAKL